MCSKDEIERAQYISNLAKITTQCCIKIIHRNQNFSNPIFIIQQVEKKSMYTLYTSINYFCIKRREYIWTFF